MEIDITNLVIHGDAFEFSASVAERGKDAGPETWANAKQEAASAPLMTDDQLPAFRAYMKEFGAWDATEIASWSATECNALLVQLVAGDVREAQELCNGDDIGDIDWKAYEALSERGTIGGCMFVSGENIYYYVGS